MVLRLWDSWPLNTSWTGPQPQTYLFTTCISCVWAPTRAGTGLLLSGLWPCIQKVLTKCIRRGRRQEVYCEQVWGHGGSLASCGIGLPCLGLSSPGGELLSSRVPGSPSTRRGATRLPLEDTWPRAGLRGCGPKSWRASGGGDMLVLDQRMWIGGETQEGHSRGRGRCEQSLRAQRP